MLDRLSNEILLKVLQKCKRIETLREIAKLNSFYEGFIEKYKKLFKFAQHVNLGLSVTKTNLSVVNYTLSILKKENIVHHYDTKTLPSDHGEIICQLLENFRSIENLSIFVGDALTFPTVLNSNFVENWLNLKTTVWKLKITDPILKCSREEFIEFCKSVKEIFVKYTKSTEHLCDEVLCKIFPYTKFELICRKTDLLEVLRLPLGFMIVGEEDVHLNLSDLTLEAMMAGQTPCNFQLCGAKTKFSIKGIRIFTQGLMRLNRRTTSTIELGVLEADQTSDANVWLKLSKGSLPYAIEAIDRGDFSCYKITNADHQKHVGLYENKFVHDWTISFKIEK